MLFQIVQPFVADIYGDSFKEAVKNYIKFNHNLKITNMIIKDQANHYETRLRYYQENNKNKVGIDVYPYTNVSYPIVTPIITTPTSPVVGSMSYPIVTQAAPIVRSPVPITIAPASVPVFSADPLVTVKGSQFMTNNKNVLINNPLFY